MVINAPSIAQHHSGISLAGAAISFMYSLWSGSVDSDYKRRRETLSFFLQYSPATRIRGAIARDPRFAKAFDNTMAVTATVVEDIENDKDGSNDAALRSNLVDLVNYNEMLCMGRQTGVLDTALFDLQLKDILKADYRILQAFLAFTVRNRNAAYPHWQATLKDWGLDASDLTK